MSLSGTIYIFTPVHNRKAVTENFVKCLLTQVDTQFHFCLIDDGSTDGTSEMVTSYLPQSTVIRGDGNLWWGGSLHEGYKWLAQQKVTSEDIVLLINDDVSFGPQYLKEARLLLERNSQAAICSQYFDQETGQLLDRGARCDFEKFLIDGAKDDSEVAFLSTRGLFLRATDFIKSEGFVPELLPHYLSDYEFTFRLKQKLGLQLITSDLIPVFGLNDQSGIPDVATYTPIKALKVIFSKRFHANPFYVANFLRLCFPEKYAKKHIRRVWARAPVFWSASLPVWLFVIIRIVYSSGLGFLRNAVSAQIQAGRDLKRRKNAIKIAKMHSEKMEGLFARFVRFQSFEAANKFLGLPPLKASRRNLSDETKRISPKDLCQLYLGFALQNRQNQLDKILIVEDELDSGVFENIKDDRTIEIKSIDLTQMNEVTPSSLVVIGEKAQRYPQFKEAFENLLQQNPSYLLFLELPLIEGSQDAIGYAGSQAPRYCVSKGGINAMLSSKFEKLFEFSHQSNDYHMVGSSFSEMTGLYRFRK